MKKITKTTLQLIAILHFAHFSFSQKTDSIKSPVHFSGSVSITNNGISIIPTFSLGKPAIITNLSLAKGRFSIEPDLRFSFDPKPWGLILWFRYKLVNAKKFHLNIGAHPALSFGNETILKDGIEKTKWVGKHYAAEELSVIYDVTKNITVGSYYLHGNGLESGTLSHANFITLNSNFKNINLGKQFALSIAPQVYYLNLDRTSGLYCSSDFKLTKQKLPLSFAVFINKTITTKISGSHNTSWNATLAYYF